MEEDNPRGTPGLPQHTDHTQDILTSVLHQRNLECKSNLCTSFGTRLQEKSERGSGRLAGTEVYTAPGMQACFRWVHDCMPTRVYWKYKPQTASIQFKETENKQDLLAREVVGAQISFYWAYGRLEVPEIMWVQTNNYKFHTFRSVHFHLSLSLRPSF